MFHLTTEPPISCRCCYAFVVLFLSRFVCPLSVVLVRLLGGSLGLYFLRTTLHLEDEVMIWNIYNTIREIESSFRTLKTYLDLRLIYHKSNAGTMAQLHLGLLAYWIVNTIRCKLKAHGINSQWQESENRQHPKNSHLPWNQRGRSSH
jgi:hypothetical protein